MNQISLKEDFTEQVKKWVLLDTQLKMVHEKVKTMREEKNTLGTKICSHLEKSGNAHRKIMIHDGNLKMYEKGQRNDGKSVKKDPQNQICKQIL